MRIPAHISIVKLTRGCLALALSASICALAYLPAVAAAAPAPPAGPYGAQTPLAPAGSDSGTLKVSQSVTGLAPLTTYHYRILATSPAGATTGAERTFKTTAVPLSLAIVGVPDPVFFGSPLTVEGTLSGSYAADHEVE